MRGLGSYRHFGMRSKWLEEFFENPRRWWRENSLGPVQFVAMRLYLKDTGIVDEKGALTSIGEALRKCGAHDPTIRIFIWSRLYWRSVIFNLYSKLPWGNTYKRAEIVSYFLEKTGNSERTVDNGILSLLETLKHSPLMDMGLGRPIFKERKVVAVEKEGLNLGERFVERAVVSSIFNALEFGKYVDLKTMEFEGSPVEVFGIGKYEAVGMASKVRLNKGLKDYLEEWCS